MTLTASDTAGPLWVPSRNLSSFPVSGSGKKLTKHWQEAGVAMVKGVAVDEKPEQQSHTPLPSGSPEEGQA